MKGGIGTLTIAAMVMAAWTASDIRAQVDVRVEGRWEWESGPGERDGRYGDYDPSHGPAWSTYGVRIPEGHRPAPGECRVWIPGVPAGQQPPPGPCDAVQRDLHGVLIVGSEFGDYGPDKDHRSQVSPRHRFENRYDDRYQRDRYDPAWYDRDGHTRDERERDYQRDRYDRNCDRWVPEYDRGPLGRNNGRDSNRNRERPRFKEGLKDRDRRGGN